jgi:hypothetical protein
VFGCPGACLLLDAANQVSQIDFLTDWNNAYGIATVDGNFTGVTPVSPGTTAPGSKRTLATAAAASGLLPSPLRIQEWNIQKSQGGGFNAALNRVHDVLDANAIMVIDGNWNATDDAGNINVGNLDVIGNGGSATGYVLRIRLRNNIQAFGPNYSTVPASGVNIRNPYGRDCLVWIAALNGSTVTQVAINTGAITLANASAPVLVPAQALYSVNWSGGSAPTACWQAI